MQYVKGVKSSGDSSLFGPFEEVQQRGTLVRHKYGCSFLSPDRIHLSFNDRRLGFHEALNGESDFVNSYTYLAGENTDIVRLHPKWMTNSNNKDNRLPRFLSVVQAIPCDDYGGSPKLFISGSMSDIYVMSNSGQTLDKMGVTYPNDQLGEWLDNVISIKVNGNNNTLNEDRRTVIQAKAHVLEKFVDFVGKDLKERIGNRIIDNTVKNPDEVIRVLDNSKDRPDEPKDIKEEGE